MKARQVAARVGAVVIVSAMLGFLSWKAGAVQTISIFVVSVVVVRAVYWIVENWG